MFHEKAMFAIFVAYHEDGSITGVHFPPLISAAQIGLLIQIDLQLFLYRFIPGDPNNIAWHEIDYAYH